MSHSKSRPDRPTGKPSAQAQPLAGPAGASGTLAEATTASVSHARESSRTKAHDTTLTSLPDASFHPQTEGPAASRAVRAGRREEAPPDAEATRAIAEATRAVIEATHAVAVATNALTLATKAAARPAAAQATRRRNGHPTEAARSRERSSEEGQTGGSVETETVRAATKAVAQANRVVAGARKAISRASRVTAAPAENKAAAGPRAARPPAAPGPAIRHPAALQPKEAPEAAATPNSLRAGAARRQAVTRADAAEVVPAPAAGPTQTAMPSSAAPPEAVPTSDVPQPAGPAAEPAIRRWLSRIAGRTRREAQAVQPAAAAEPTPGQTVEVQPAAEPKAEALPQRPAGRKPTSVPLRSKAAPESAMASEVATPASTPVSSRPQPKTSAVAAPSKAAAKSPPAAKPAPAAKLAMAPAAGPEPATEPATAPAAKPAPAAAAIVAVASLPSRAPKARPLPKPTPAGAPSTAAAKPAPGPAAATVPAAAATVPAAAARVPAAAASVPASKPKPAPKPAHVAAPAKAAARPAPAPVTKPATPPRPAMTQADTGTASPESLPAARTRGKRAGTRPAGPVEPAAMRGRSRRSATASAPALEPPKQAEPTAALTSRVAAVAASARAGLQVVAGPFSRMAARARARPHRQQEEPEERAGRAGRATLEAALSPSIRSSQHGGETAEEVPQPQESESSPAGNGPRPRARSRRNQAASPDVAGRGRSARLSGPKLAHAAQSSAGTVVAAPSGVAGRVRSIELPTRSELVRAARARGRALLSFREWDWSLVSLIVADVVLAAVIVSLQSSQLRLDSMGLLPSLSQVYIFGLVLFVAAAAMALLDRHVGPWLFLGYAFVFGFLMWVTPLILEGTPHFRSAYQNLGYVDPIIRGYGLVPGAIIYHNWPVFPLLMAAFIDITNISTLTLLEWWPIVMVLLYAAVVVCLVAVLGRRVQSRMSLAIGMAFAAWSYFLFDWTEQEYFSPQALAYLVFLVLLCVLAWSSIERDGDLTPRMTVAALGLFALIVATHVLTSLVVLGVVFALVVTRHIRRPTLLITYGLMFIAWQVTVAAPFFVYYSSQLMSSVLGITNFLGANLNGRVRGDPGHMFVTELRVAASGLPYALAGLVVISILWKRSWRDAIRHPSLSGIRALPASVRALPGRARAAAPGLRSRAPYARAVAWRPPNMPRAVSFPTAAIIGTGLIAPASAYGGEMLIRVLFFSLPALCALIAFGVQQKWFRGLMLATFVVMAPLHILTEYGNEQLDYVSSGEIAGMEYLSTLGPANVFGGFPAGSTYNMIKLDARNAFTFAAGEPTSLADYADPWRLYTWVHKDWPLYVCISRGDDADMTLFTNRPNFIAQAMAQMDADPNYERVYRNQDFAIYLYKPSTALKPTASDSMLSGAWAEQKASAPLPLILLCTLGVALAIVVEVCASLKSRARAQVFAARMTIPAAALSVLVIAVCGYHVATLIGILK